MSDTIAIDRKLPLPLYYQLKETLRGKLQKEFSSGDRFYSERQLSDMLSVSRITAGRVLNDLVQEGLLYRLQGKGTYVADTENKKKTFNIGFMISDRLNMLDKLAGNENNFRQMMYIQKVCEKYGYNMLSISENPGEDGQKKAAKVIEKIDGIIFQGDVDNSVISFFNKNIPSIIMDNCPTEEKFDCVLGDNIAGAYENVSYLINSGHRRVAIIHGPLTVASFRERLEGYKKAFADNNIEYSQELTAEADGLIEKGYDAMAELLKHPNHPTAVFASNDIMAIGAMKKIKEAGLRIPEDISVTGFDDIDLASHTEPPLTTVRFDQAQLAERTIKLLIDKMSNKPTETRINRIPVELIIRNSSSKRETI